VLLLAWTLAWALLLLAIAAAAVLPAKGPSVHPVATRAASLALAFALLASLPERIVWPWQRPDRLRNTVALVLLLVAMAFMQVEMSRGVRLTDYAQLNEFRAHSTWVQVVFSTLMFLSSIASTRLGRWNWPYRVTCGCFMGLYWGSWFQMR